MEQWVADIETRYRSLDPVEHEERITRRSIYKWPNDLVAASSLSRHRTPSTVSLGPYHHGEEHLQPMERHKKGALYRILRRSNIPLITFVQSLEDVEQELRDSYDNLDLNLSRHLFLRIMLFDGCFLLELLRSQEPLFGSDGWSPVAVIQQDMLILENQIPLLVLEKLLAVEEGNNMNNHDYLHRLVLNFFDLCFPIHGPSLHILDIYRKSLIGDNTALVEEETPISVCSHFQLHLAGKGLKRMLIAIPILVFWLLHRRIPKHGHFRTATRLHEAGIKFKKGEPSSGLTITFDERNGVLTLPCIQIDDRSPTACTNLLAFERMHPPLSGNKKVTEYMALMDQLIDTAEDVSMLCSQGIVNNLLASDEIAAKFFNAFSDGRVFCGCNAQALSRQWECYAVSGWNRERAHLNRYYFQNRWSVVSLLAAIILLVLTIIQTVFSGMQA